MYKLKQSRLVMVLEGIERRLVDGGLTEVMKLGNSLWIEHLLPQGWRSSDSWALPDGTLDVTQAGLTRDHLLHTLGNLTLTTSKLDIELSNRPWPEKLEALEASSALALNRELLLLHRDRWHEDKIRLRGAQMAERIIAIWPGPDALLSQLT